MNVDLQLALDCLRFSQLAYTSATISDAATSTELIIGGRLSDPETLVIAFRGSKEPRDYIYDARFIIKNAWPGQPAAKVHRGFDEGFWSVAGETKTKVRGARRIVCTGHSLGGDRAMECALHLKNCGFPVTDVITFGAARVGNAAFRDYYNSVLGNQTLRFEAQGDPVPWMPLLLNGYRHPGRAVYLKNDGSAEIDPPLVDHLPAFVHTLLPQSQNLPAHFIGVFKPHFIENYERLFAQLKEAA